MFVQSFDKTHHLQLSSCNKYLIVNVDNALEIYEPSDYSKYEIKGRIALSDQKCSHLSISDDEQYVATINKSFNVLTVFDIAEKKEVFKMQDDNFMVINLIWNPNSLTFLAFSDFNAKVTIGKPSNQVSEIQQIDNPKSSNDNHISFTNGGNLLALVTKNKQYQDQISIFYSRERLQLQQEMPIDTLDCQSIKWTSDGSYIVVADSHLDAKVSIYSPVAGLLTVFVPGDNCVGLSTIQLNQKEDILAMGHYDQKIRLMNLITSMIIDSFEIKDSYSLGYDVLLLKEEENQILSHEEKRKFKVQSTKQKDQSYQSINKISWSFCSNFIAFKSELQPQNVYIFNVKLLRLVCIITLKEPIKKFEFNKNFKEQILVIVSNSNKLVIWTPKESQVHTVPQYESNYTFRCSSFNWDSSGTMISIMDKSRSKAVLVDIEKYLH